MFLDTAVSGRIGSRRARGTGGAGATGTCGDWPKAIRGKTEGKRPADDLAGSLGAVD